MPIPVASILMPLFRTAAILAASPLVFGQGGTLERTTGIALPFVVPVFSVQAVLLLLADVAAWFVSPVPARRLLRPWGSATWTQRQLFHRRKAAEVLRVLFAGGAGLTLVAGFAAVWPALLDAVQAAVSHPALLAVQPYTGFIRALFPWILSGGLFFLVASAGARLWASLPRVLPIPWRPMGVLVVLFGFLHGGGYLSVALNFDGQSALVAVVAGAVALYAAGSARRLVGELYWWVDDDRHTRVRERTGLLIAVLQAGGGVLFVWGGLTLLLPAAEVLREHGDLRLGGVQLADLLVRVHGLRFPVLAASGVAFAVRALRTEMAKPHAAVPVVEAVALGIVAAAAWLIGTELSPLGRGYQLTGAMAAAGLAGVAVARMAAYGVSAPSAVVAGWAGWAGESMTRAFTLGAALAFYGLFLRPALYERLWFAPLYEWVAVLLIAVVVISRTGIAVARSLAEPPVPPAWPKWKRHEQQVADLPDAYFTEVIGVVRRYLQGGRTPPLWCYLLSLLLHNDAPVDAMATVVGPLLDHRDPSPGWLWYPGKERRLRTRREAARLATVRLVQRHLDGALRRLGARLPLLDAAHLREEARRFTEGAAPLRLSLILVAASWQRGADPYDAALAWYWLAIYEDRKLHWYHAGWWRRRIVAHNRRRREELAAAAVQRVAGENARPIGRVSLVRRWAVVEEGRGATTPMRSAKLLVDWPVELLDSQLMGYDTLYRVRTLEGVEGTLFSSVLRRPIMPPGRRYDDARDRRSQRAVQAYR